LLMADWIDELGTKDLEARYHVWAGAVRRLGEEYGWLVDALAGIARASGWPDARVATLQALATRLPHGVAPDAVAIARLRVKGVGRALLRRLVDAGLRDRETLRSAGRERIAEILKHRAATAALWSAVEGREGPFEPPLPAPKARAQVARDSDDSPDQALIVDLRSRRVTYGGRAIPTRPPDNLQRQAFLALAVLAARAGEVVTMVDLAAGIQKLGHLSRRLVTPEPKEIRYKLIRPFRKALAGIVDRQDIDNLVENVPGVGLRLNPTGGARVVGARAEST
jgi:hypothetical protein